MIKRINGVSIPYNAKAIAPIRTEDEDPVYSRLEDQDPYPLHKDLASIIFNDWSVIGKKLPVT